MNELIEGVRRSKLTFVGSPEPSERGEVDQACTNALSHRGGLILRYRCVDVAPPEHERIRRAFASPSELTVRTLSETPGMTVPGVLRLVLDGTLHIDWWEPLCLDSKVSITPIGRRVWPLPYPESSGRHLPEARCR